MSGRPGSEDMDLDAPRLFLKGLRWSYRRYGTKGALGYLLLGVVGYWLFVRKVKPALEGRDEGGADERDAGA